jgi:hypothetical protein
MVHAEQAGLLGVAPAIGAAIAGVTLTAVVPKIGEEGLDRVRAALSSRTGSVGSRPAGPD